MVTSTLTDLAAKTKKLPSLLAGFRDICVPTIFFVPSSLPASKGSSPRDSGPRVVQDLLEARTLLGAPGITTRNKDATRGSYQRIGLKVRRREGQRQERGRNGPDSWW